MERGKPRRDGNPEVQMLDILTSESLDLMVAVAIASALPDSTEA
jgi:hypothetical protein